MTGLENIENSPFFIGGMMLLLNIGSRHISAEFSDSDEEHGDNMLLRRLAIFAVCFTATRDIVISFILTAAFVILCSVFWKKKSIDENMSNEIPDLTLSAAAGISGNIDNPPYDKDTKELFTKV